MLSAFRAQPIHELKQRDKSKIESLLGYGDRLLVGLNTGILRIYRVNNDAPPEVEEPEGQSKARVVELLKEEEKFSKKPVQQLARIKEANVLVSLSDTYVSLHDLQTFELVERLERTRGATCFTVTSHVVKESEQSIPSLVSRLAVGVKRKVMCWTWQDMEMLPEVPEINMEAAVKSLTWVSGNKLIVGMDPGFSVLDIETQQITPINKPATVRSDNLAVAELAGARFAAVSSSGMGYMGMGSWLPRPMATGMSDGQVLLAKDVNTLFTDADGKPLDKRQIPWSLAPDAIGYSYPYLLALLPPEKGTLHIRNPDTLNLLQSIAVPGASILHVPQPNISLAHAGKGFLVASDRTIWRMNALPYDAQIKELVQRQRYDEAISLLKLLEDTLIDDKDGRIREVSIQKAITWFQQQNYRPALDLLTNVQAPVERVVALYPKVISGSLSTSVVDSNSETDVASDGGETTAVESTSKEPHNTLTKGMLNKLIGSTLASHDSDTASTRSSARSDTDNMSIRSKPSANKKSDKTNSKPLEGDDLKTAVQCLLSFLAQARQQVQKYMDTDGMLKDDRISFDPETGRPGFANLLAQSVVAQNPKDVDWHAELLKVAQLVDTTLFKSYMLASPRLAGSLFRLANFCDPEVVQASLYENDRYSDLIDFLHGKKLHRPALEMLQKFGMGKASAEVPEGMQGPARTVAYLKQLPPEMLDLILEFVRWPIEENVDLGMSVFLEDSDNAERLDRGRVLGFLAEIDSKLEMKYLEHIINELGDQDPDHHQRLVDVYLQGIKAEKTASDERQSYQNRLEKLLETSNFYNKIHTFRQLPADDSRLWESRAIVLSAMGNHKQALSIYVFQLQDYSKAEAYCHRVYTSSLADETSRRPTSASRSVSTTTSSLPTSNNRHLSNDSADIDPPNIYATLLGLYLQPPAGEETRWPPALELLAHHGARLPTSSTLALMPDALAVRDLQSYFHGRIRHATSVAREERIVRGLEDVRRARLERRLALGADAADDDGLKHGRNRRVRISDEDHCSVCHKRFGASAVKVFPDGVVIHYGCGARRGVVASASASSPSVAAGNSRTAVPTVRGLA